jgi:hypothetical protein
MLRVRYAWSNFLAGCHRTHSEDFQPEGHAHEAGLSDAQPR